MGSVMVWCECDSVDPVSLYIYSDPSVPEIWGHTNSLLFYVLKIFNDVVSLQTQFVPEIIQDAASALIF